MKFKIEIGIKEKVEKAFWIKKNIEDIMKIFIFLLTLNIYHRVNHHHHNHNHLLLPIQINKYKYNVRNIHHFVSLLNLNSQILNTNIFLPFMTYLQSAVIQDLQLNQVIILHIHIIYLIRNGNCAMMGQLVNVHMINHILSIRMLKQKRC